ncbi:MAG: response regulator [Patescibacteria group bacterium]
MKKTVLFLDDEEVVAEITIKLMRALGVDADFTVAHSLGEAIRIIAERGKQFQFNVAVLDYQLPDGYGTTLMESIRRFYPNCRVCVYSALIDADPEATRIIRRYAPEVMLPKPFKIEILGEALQKLDLLPN